jgi:hypothetical protein
MTWMAAAVATSAVIGGIASNQAAGTQADASRYAADLQYRQYKEGVQRQKPFYEAGVNALPELIAASKYTPFDYNAYQNDPGVAFRLKKGVDALDRSAASRGGLLSGNQLRGVTEFGQELGSQEYTNAFNRYQTERAARLNPLQSLTGMGQTTANTIGNMGQNMATNVGNDMQSGANARASGYIGGANALSGGFGQYLNYNNAQNNANFQNQLLSRFMPQNSSGAPANFTI